MPKTVRRVTVNLSEDDEGDLAIIRKNFHDSSDSAALRRCMRFHAECLKLPYDQRVKIGEYVKKVVGGGCEA